MKKFLLVFFLVSTVVLGCGKSSTNPFIAAQNQAGIGGMATSGTGGGAAGIITTEPPAGNGGSGGMTLPPGDGGSSGSQPTDPPIAGSAGIDQTTPPTDTIVTPPTGGTGGIDVPPPPVGDCKIHGDPPAAVTLNGPYTTANYPGTTGVIYYPTNAEPPFAGVSVCGGFLNTGAEMLGWGTLYASYGIVAIITTTTGMDFNDVRATKLLASIEELKAENGKAGSPLNGKMCGNYGTSGYSMGGGGTTIASVTDPTLKSSVGLAPFMPNTNMTVPTLFLQGGADAVAGVATLTVAAGTPSLQVVITAYTHMEWMNPTDIMANYAVSWQKVFLEGDTRWKSFLTTKVGGVGQLNAVGL